MKQNFWNFFGVEKIKELKKLYYRIAHFISDHGMGYEDNNIICDDKCNENI